MRGEIPRIISLILILFLLNAPIVSAQPMPMIVGSVFKFEKIRTMNCDVYPYSYYDGMDVGKDITEFEYLITEYNYKAEIIYYDYAIGDSSGSNSKSISIDQLDGIIHPSYEKINFADHPQRVGEIAYYPDTLPTFIKPDFEGLNNQIWESLYREDDNHLGEAIIVEFMGKDSIDKGAERLDSDNRKWNIYLYFINTVNSVIWEFKVWREWEYNREGLLKYSKIKKKTKPADTDDWCSYESIFKNTDSIFSPLYGTEVNSSLFLFLIPIIIIYLWIKRKKIPRIL